MSDNAQTTVISAELNLETSKLESQLTSTKRSLKDLGEAFKDVRQKTAEALSAVPTGSGAEKGIEALNKSIVKKTGEVSLAIAAYGTEAQQSIVKAFSNIDIGKEQFKLMSKGAGQGFVDTYVAQLKELEGKIKASYAMQAQAAEQAAKASKAAADLEAANAARIAEIRAKAAADSKAQADREIAANKERAASLKAYLTEVQNAELNMLHTGRGKSSAMLVDKGQRLGFTEAEVSTAVAGLKKVEAAQIAAFAAANPHIEKLRAQAEASNTSVKGLSASLRNVPAQFTDIIVSLQGGQAPLTVLMQQGGQLKDMFGGIGPAIRALGGYVMGLINPFTVAVMTISTLGIAYYEGDKEARAFAATLINTGNQAGVTSGQLMGMASAVAAVSGTQGNAADVLNQLASTGQVASSNLQQAALAAVQFEKAGGQAASETVKSFAELGKSPLEASLRLNESMGYLTKSTYAQIKALMEQGRETEAATVAQKAFADALGSRSGEMVKNLGLVEKGWSDIKATILGAWDAIKSIGRDTGVEGQASATSAAIKSLEAQIALRGSTADDTLFNRKTIQMKEELAALKEHHSVLQSDVRLAKSAAEGEAQRAREVKAYAEFQKEGNKYLGETAKMELELVRIRNLGIAGALTEEQITKRQADYLKSQMKDGPKAPKKDTAVDKELEAEAAILAKLSGVNKDYLEQLTRLQNIRAKGNIDEEQYVELITELINIQPGVVKAAKEHADELKRQAEAAAAANTEFDAYFKRMEDIRLAGEGVIKGAREYAESIDAQVKASEFELTLMGKTNTERAIALKQYKIQIELEKELDKVRRSDATDPLKAEARNRYIAAADKAKANAAAEVVNDEFKRVSAQIEQSLTDALMRGFESGKGFAEVLRDTVVNMFKTMVLRPIVSAVVSPVAGAITGAMGFSGAANAATGGLSALGSIGGTGNLLGSLGASATYGTSLVSQQGAMLAAQEAGMGTLAGGASSLGAALPWIGGALALVSLISSLDDSGTMHTGGAALADSINGVREIEAATIGFGLAAADVSSQIVGSSKQMASSALGLLQGLDAMSGGKNKFSVATGFADDSSKDGAWGSLAISKNGASLVNWADTQTSRWAPKEFADGEAGAKQYGDAVAAGIKQAIDTLDLPDWAGNIVAKLGDAPSMDSLNAAVQQIMAMPEQMLQAIGTSSQALAGTIYTGMQASDPMGAGKAVADQITYGIEASLYQGFAGQVTGIISTQLVTPVLSAMQAGATLTEAMASASIDTMRAQVAAAGAAFAAIVSDPGFKDALAGINTLIAEAVGGAVDGYTAPTAPAAYAPPSPIAPIVASTVSGAGSVADAVTDLAKVFADAKDSLLETGRSLSADLLRAQGDEAGALAAERAIHLAGFSQLGQAERDRLGVLYDQNQAIRLQITLAEQLSSATSSLIQDSKSLTVDLRRASGNEAGARVLERSNYMSEFAGLTQTEKDRIGALYDQNQAIRDQVTLVQKYTSEVSNMVSSGKSLAIDLLRTNGDEAGALAAERANYLAGFADMGRAEQARLGLLYDQTQAIKDQITAAQKSIALTKELADSLPGVIAKFLTPEQNTANSYLGIAQNLVDAGVSGMSVDDTTTGLTGATKAQFVAVAAAIYNAAGTTDTMRLAILKAASAFADLQDSATAAAKAVADQRLGLEGQLLQLQGNTVELRKRELAALDPSNRALQQQIWAFEDLTTAVDTSFAGVERAVAAQRKLAETSRAAAQTLVTEVKGVFDTLQSAVDDLFGRTDSTKQWQAAQGQQYIAAALDAARATGALPDGKELSRAISAATGGLDAKQYRTQAEADFARLVLANELQALQGISGKQLTEAERQLRAAEDSLTALDQTLDTARNQLDELKGINKGVSSLPDALATFAASLAAAAGVRTSTGAGGVGGVGAAGGAGTATGGTGATGSGGFYGSPLSNWEQTAGTGFIDGNGIMRDTAGLALPMDMLVKATDVTGSLADVAAYAKANGLTADDVATAYQQLGYINTDKQDILDWAKNTGVPAFADGGWHAGGWAMVGEHGPELAYMPPSQIYTAPQTASMLGGGNSAEVVAELRLLRQENKELRLEIAEIKTATQQTATGLEAVTRGNALITKTAEAF